MLIKIRSRKAASLPYLLRLVLKHIYEPENFSLAEEDLMQHSFVNWINKVNLSEDERWILERLGWMVQKNMDGGYDKRKASFKQHGIDYKKFHRLPEAYLINATPRKVMEQVKRNVMESAQ